MQIPTEIMEVIEGLEEGAEEIIEKAQERRKRIRMSNTCKLLKENIEAESKAGSEYDILAKNARKHDLEALAFTSELIRDNEVAHNKALRRYYDKHCK